MSYFKKWPEKCDLKIDVQDLSQAEWNRRQIECATDPSAFDQIDYYSQEKLWVDEKVDCPF